MIRPLLPSALIVLVLGACSSRDGSEEESAAEDGADTTEQSINFTQAQVGNGGVRWAPAATGTIGFPVTLPGLLLPNDDRTARLGALVDARVIDVKVQPGDRVAAGEALVMLHSPAAGMARAELTGAQADLSARQAAATVARAARQRAERLLELRAIPRQDYERATAEDELAQAELIRAQAELDRARSTASQLGAESSGEMVVRSPIAGVVLTRNAVPGTVVEAGALLVEVTNPASLWLVIHSPENLVSSFTVGQRLRFTTPAFAADSFIARVEAIGAGLDTATRTLAIRALVANNARRLRPQMLATVLVEDSGRATGIVLPEDAVQLVDGQPSVFIAMPMGETVMFTRRPVQVGQRSAGRIAIVSGLTAGELVVTHGAFAIKAEMAKGSMPEEMEM